MSSTASSMGGDDFRSTSFNEYAQGIELGKELPLQLSDRFGADATPYEILRGLVPRAVRRANGTFFTSAQTAQKMWEGVDFTAGSKTVIVDPACGAGDLLVPILETVMDRKLEDFTIRACDIDDDLTRIAVARLRGMDETFSGIVEGRSVDFLLDSTSLLDATHVALNPPFVPTVVDESWASGQVNAAAVFVMQAINAMRSGSRLLAVLPDVLRSGSRYSSWRAEVERLSFVNRVQAEGIFDDQTDVHVFILDVSVGTTGSQLSWGPETSQSCLGEYADVRVGPVVPHRDPESGDRMRFVTARSLSSGEVLHRRYSGRKEHGPLILVNRTSRPGESPRVRARLWDQSGNLAVENHLLVVKPKAGTDLVALLEVLQSDETAEFLDDRIRCRHLTVTALKEIPWQI